MAITLNFGWLNDYSGTKFAPFTLADKVLLNGEKGTVQNFFDYVNNKDNQLTDLIRTNQDNITLIENTLNGILNDPPLEVDGKTPTERRIVQQAYYLMKSPKPIPGVDKGGAEAGSSILPIYFNRGIPVPCATTEGKNTNKTIEIPSIYPRGKDSYTQDYTIVSSPIETLLSINISGKAEHAGQADNAGTAKYADQAEVAKNALSSNKLGQNITVVGDITGTITTNEPESNTTLNLIDLKNMGNNTFTPGAAEPSTANPCTAFSIPKISTDSKGRITAISMVNIKPALTLQSVPKEGVTYTSAPLTAVKADGNTQTFVYNTTVTLDWSDSKEVVVMGAAWNDYAEFRNQMESIQPGYCVASTDDGKVYKTTEKLQACDGIVSDTFGFSIGKTDTYKTPLAVAGRVLAYYSGDIKDYHSGDTVCAGPDGKIMKMTREEIKEYPDRIVGVVSEIPTYEAWNNAKTAGRIWIKVK